METASNFPKIKSLATKEEFSVNDIFRELLIWKFLVIKFGVRILLVSSVGAVLGFFYAKSDTPIYTATTRFMLKNEGVGSLFGGQMTGLSSLLGGGQMGTPLERTAEVISSDRIIGKALLSEIKIRDTTDIVINHFIRLSNNKKVRKMKLEIKKIFLPNKDFIIDSLSREQRKVFKEIKNLITSDKGDGVVKKIFDKKSGVLSLTCTHNDEDFAIAFCNLIYVELSNFFVEQMTYTASNNAHVLKKKMDSLQRELNNIRNQFAIQSDQSLGLLLQKDKVDLKALGIKEQMLNVMYAETLKNFEAFQFVNQAAMPSLTLIDYPYSPLKFEKLNILKYTLSFFVIFLFLVFFICRIFYYKK